MYREHFESEEYGVWFRIFTFALTFLSGLLGVAGGLLRHPVLRKVSSACLILGVFAVMFNVLFGLRTAAVVLCNGDIKDACMEAGSCGGDAPVRDWQAFLFSFTLCVLLCSLSVAVNLLLSDSTQMLLQQPVHLPETLNQSALEASMTHDNSPGKKGKADSLEKSDLLEPVFVPTNKPQVPTFAKDSEVTDLVSSKDFDGSLGRSGSIRGRGRGRGK